MNHCRTYLIPPYIDCRLPFTNLTRGYNSGLSGFVIVIVIVSTFMHAGWNLLARDSGSEGIYTAGCW